MLSFTRVKSQWNIHNSYFFFLWTIRNNSNYHTIPIQIPPIFHQRHFFSWWNLWNTIALRIVMQNTKTYFHKNFFFCSFWAFFFENLKQINIGGKKIYNFINCNERNTETMKIQMTILMKNITIRCSLRLLLTFLSVNNQDKMVELAEWTWFHLVPLSSNGVTNKM